MGKGHLEVHDEGSMQGGDRQVQHVYPNSDGEGHAAQCWLPFQLPGSLQVMVLAGICVQHCLYLYQVASCRESSAMEAEAAMINRKHSMGSSGKPTCLSV